MNWSISVLSTALYNFPFWYTRVTHVGHFMCFLLVLSDHNIQQYEAN